MLLLFQPNLSDKPAALKTPAWEEEPYFQPRRVFASLGVALVVASSFNPAFRQVRFDAEDYFAGARKFAPVAAQVQSTKSLSQKLPSLEEDQYANSPRRAFAPVSSAAPLNPVINLLRQFWTYEGGGSGSSSSSISAPQGRLSLTSSPVMAVDAVASTTINYLPYQGNGVFVNGVIQAFSSLALALDTTNHVAGNLYDIFVYLNGTTLSIAAGPAWSSTSARSAAISQTNGIWVNTSNITLTNGAGAGNTALAGAATYIGTFYATANGQTAMSMNPAGAAGGTGNVLGVWNAYNRVKIVAACFDSTASWTYATAAWRPSDGSTSNRVTWVDGLAQSAVFAHFDQTLLTAPTGAVGTGVALDNTTTPLSSGQANNIAANATLTQLSIGANAPPQLGLHYLQEMEYAYTGTNTFYGNVGAGRQNNALRVELDM